MEALLTLFENLTEHLRQLTELARRKTTAVCKSDLLELDKILKEDQAQSLALRGIDQKRTSLLQQLGLDQIPVIEIPSHFPTEAQQTAKNVIETMQREFAIYRSAAEVARNTLECNLHEVEKFLAAVGAVNNTTPGEVSPPPQMKSDFRA